AALLHHEPFALLLRGQAPVAPGSARCGISFVRHFARLPALTPWASYWRSSLLAPVWQQTGALSLAAITSVPLLRDKRLGRSSCSSPEQCRCHKALMRNTAASLFPVGYWHARGSRHRC